jgi:hypothetical protein
MASTLQYSQPIPRGKEDLTVDICTPYVLVLMYDVSVCTPLNLQHFTCVSSQSHVLGLVPTCPLWRLTSVSKHENVSKLHELVHSQGLGEKICHIVRRRHEIDGKMDKQHNQITTCCLPFVLLLLHQTEV